MEGTIGRLQPGTRDTLYEDQPGNPTVLSSKPFRSFPISIGGARGVPDWVVDKINLIWSCNSVFVDGKSFAKAGDTKLDLREEKNYPMRGVLLTVREGINRQSKIVEPGLNPNLKLVQLIPIEGTVFGDVALGASSNIITIQATN